MTATTIRTLLRSDELSCPSCVSKIEKSLLALPGVMKAEVKLSSGRIEHDPALSNVTALVNSVAKAGYAARPASILTVDRRSDRHASSLSAWRPTLRPAFGSDLVCEGEILCFPG